MDIILLALMIVLNGIFALSEMSLVSVKKARLKILADGKSKGAKAALRLSENPGRMISTVQLGITLTSVLAGAYSSATIAGTLEEYFVSVGLFMGSEKELSIALVVMVVTVITLVLGEIVPKQIGLRYPERIACIMAIPMDIISKVLVPAVAFLDYLSKMFIYLFTFGNKHTTGITHAEVKALVEEAASTGVFEADEKNLIDGILKLDERQVKAIMTPRQQVEWIDITEKPEVMLKKLLASNHTFLVACEENIEHPVGVVAVKDAVAAFLAYGEKSVSRILRKPLALSEALTVLEALRVFRRESANIAFVVDEYGSLEGIITHKDILQAIVGVMPEQSRKPVPSHVIRADGSFLIDALMEVSLVEEILGTAKMLEDDDDYVTLAGFVIAKLGALPKEGQVFEWEDFRFEIVDMDGNRVDKVLVTRKIAED